MLGRGSEYLPQALEGAFIGADFGIAIDLSNDLRVMEDWKTFNKKYIPEYLKVHPGKSKITAGLSCGFLWTISKAIKPGSIVLSPKGNGEYALCEVQGDYEYMPGQILPHRRKVEWFKQTLSKSEFSEDLRNSAGSIGTVSNLTKYSEELENLLIGKAKPAIRVDDETVEDVSEFALERHLEEFLIRNWDRTELSKNYDIYSDEEVSGQQYQTDTGPIDILAISKDRKELLVIELKKGRASDSVVGQVQRYMGYVMEELLEPGQNVKGLIIGLDEDLKLKRALMVNPNIDFYRYVIDFRLVKG